MSAFDRYADNLRNPRPPGTGCHGWIMSTADLGIMAGIDGNQIFTDIRRTIPQGNRKVGDKEIQEAIRKALSDHNGGTFTPRPRPEPIVQNGKAALQRIINQAKISDEYDLWEASPIRLLGGTMSDEILLLKTFYVPTDLVWIGDRHQAGIHGDTIRTAADWITYFRNGGNTAPHIIPNPLTGMEGTTKAGKPSFRSDNTVKTYRYCMAEFDTLNREYQIRFWSVAKLPIVALIDSGGKSIHAWLQVSKIATVTSLEQWAPAVKGRLYDCLLTPLGIDRACSNPARLSRLPGHYRAEKQAWQRLLWLSPEGRSICSP